MSAPIGLQVGETYKDGDRTMIVDKVLGDGAYIVHAEGFKEPKTPEPDDGKAKLRAEIEAEIRPELEALIKVELEEKIRAEVMAELTKKDGSGEGDKSTGDTTLTTPNAPELKCRYCGKPYKEASWLASHEEKCPQNPENAGK